MDNVYLYFDRGDMHCVGLILVRCQSLFHLMKIFSQKGFDTFCLFLLSDDYFKGSYLIMLSLLFTCKNAFWSQLV